MPVSTRSCYLLTVLAIASLVSACGNTVDLRVSANEQPPSQPPVAPVTGNGVATLSWLPPTQNSDGSPLLDLAGYRVYSGRAATGLLPIVRVDNPGITVVVVDGLASGTHYFAVSAFAASGAESALSAVGRKQVP